MTDEKNIKKDFPIEQWANPTNESVNADKPLALPASVEPNYPKESGATACQNGEMSVCQNGEIYSPNCQSGQDLAAEVKEVAYRLIASGKDITYGYENWRDLGFALADGLGEEGRDIYHKLSAQHPNYNPAECDKQYNACLKDHGKGRNIRINTFFHMPRRLVWISPKWHAFIPIPPKNLKMGEVGKKGSLQLGR